MVDVRYFIITVSVGSEPDGHVAEVSMVLRVFYDGTSPFRVPCITILPRVQRNFLADSVYEPLKGKSDMSDVCLVRRNCIILPVKATLLSLTYLDERCAMRGNLIIASFIILPVERSQCSYCTITYLIFIERLTPLCVC
jgi:hypothetical protein